MSAWSLCKSKGPISRENSMSAIIAAIRQAVAEQHDLELPAP